MKLRLLKFIKKWNLKTKKKIIPFFITKEAGQKRPHNKNIGILVLFIGVFIVSSLILRAINQDTSEISQTSQIKLLKKTPKP